MPRDRGQALPELACTLRAIHRILVEQRQDQRLDLGRQLGQVRPRRHRIEVQVRTDQLSGAEQQRVAVARALLTDPALLLADEPTGNLDSRSSAEIATLLTQAAGEWGRAILMVTHDPRIAAHAHRIVFMRDGHIVEDTEVADSDEARDAIEKVGLL